MDDLRLRQVPAAKTGMLIRRPAADVFEAFVNPDITTKFWFTRSSGRLEAGNGDELVTQVTNSTQGFSLLLAGLRAFLEHGIRLNLVADRFPKGIAEH